MNYPPLGSNSVFGRIAEKYPDEPSRFRRLQFLFNKYIRETEKTPYVSPGEEQTGPESPANENTRSVE